MSEIGTENLSGLVFDEVGPITPDHTASASPGDTEPPSGPPTGDDKRKGWRDRVGTTRTPREPKPVPPKPRPGELVKPLTEMYVSLGAVVMAFDPQCGTAVMQNAEECAKSLDNLARANPAVRRAIIALTQTGAWGGVLAAHMPILLIIMVHHGPKDMANSVKPYAAMLNGISLDDMEGSGDAPANE